jgi:EAL domain-containing protein (putative c-di-GMP-specific phosphodiesterase class I)
MQVSQSFGADTVAVGVEQYEQATALIALGCTRMQGHLFEHALPAEELGRRFTDGALTYPAIQG